MDAWLQKLKRTTTSDSAAVSNKSFGFILVSTAISDQSFVFISLLSILYIFCWLVDSCLCPCEHARSSNVAEFARPSAHASIICRIIYKMFNIISLEPIQLWSCQELVPSTGYSHVKYV